MAPTGKHVAVIGAGIVGVSTAIWLRREGHQVTLIDRTGPAAETSYGNAGLLATSAVVPVTVPGLLKKAPRMLFDRREPLFLRWRYLPKLLPWLIGYLRHANARNAREISGALAPITLDCVDEHLALAKGTGAEKWIVPSDYLFVYKSRKDFEKEAFGWGLRRQLGLTWQELDGSAFHDFDPAFGGDLNFAVKMGGHGRISDPGAYVADLAQHFTSNGGELVIGNVDDIVTRDGKVRAVIMGEERLDVSSVVLATGAWSEPLARKLGLKIPLETERGYHIEFWDPSITPKSSAMVVSGKFVATPMEGRLRLAGIVEFGGLKADPSRAPFELLKESAKLAFPDLEYSKITEWMGHRPATTDSLPVIGESPQIEGAFVGYGHQHIGLTTGPKTGRILAQLISGKRPNFDISAYRPDRFE